MTTYNMKYTVAVNVHNEAQAYEFIRYLENGMGFEKVSADICEVIMVLDLASYNDVMRNDFYHNEFMFEYVTSYAANLTITKVNKE